MKYLKTLFAITAFLGLAGLVRAQGTPVQRTTKLSIGEPTEVSGTILQPGTYTLKVLDYKGGKVQVQVSDENDQHVITTVMTEKLRRNLDSKQAQDDQSHFTYTTANGHPALKTWFYPNDEWGEQFQTGLATWKTEEVGTVTQTPAETKTEVTTAPAPAPAPEPIAENTAPAPAPESAPAPTELPKTASDLPLFGLAGLLAIGGAAGLRFLNR